MLQRRFDYNIIYTVIQCFTYIVKIYKSTVLIVIPTCINNSICLIDLANTVLPR